MLIDDGIEPKLGEIRRQAELAYRDYLQAISLTIDAQGRVVPGTAAQLPTPDTDLAAAQVQWERYQSDVETLCRRFRRFYGLDPLNMHLVATRFSGFGVDSEPSIASSAATVRGRLHYANNHWMIWVDGLFTSKDWRGTAADAFYHEFLKPFQRASELQQWYACELGLAGAVLYGGIRAVIEDLNNLADQCIAVLRGDIPADRHYTTVGLIAAVVGFFPAAGLPANIAGLATGLLSAFQEAVKSDDPPAREMVVDGANGPQVIASAHAAMTELERLIDANDVNIKFALERDLDEPFHDPRLRLARPALASGTADLDGLNIAAAAGADEDPVVAAIEGIYQAGHQYLPGAAGEYAAAAGMLQESLMPARERHLFPRSAASYDQAVTNLAGILSDITESLTGVAHSLTTVATGYELTDAQQAEFIRRIGTIPAGEARELPDPHTGPGRQPI